MAVLTRLRHGGKGAEEPRIAAAAADCRKAFPFLLVVAVLKAIGVAPLLLGRAAGAGVALRQRYRLFGSGKWRRREVLVERRRFGGRAAARAASRMRQTSSRLPSVMVRTSPGPTLRSEASVRSELTRTAPDSMNFCASVRDFTAREKNSHLSRR